MTVKMIDCLQEFPRASASETPSGKGVYLTIYPSSRPNTDTVHSLRAICQSIPPRANSRCSVYWEIHLTKNGILKEFYLNIPFLRLYNVMYGNLEM